MAGILLSVAFPLSACSQSSGDSSSERRAIAQSQAIASDFLQTELALSPETASRLGMERTLGPATSFALDNHSQAGFERRRLVRIELLQRLRQRPRLPEGHALIDDLAIAERALSDLISLEQLGYGRFNYQTMRPYAIDPYSGIWIEGPTLLAFRQSINTIDQATAFVTRLQSLSAALQDTRRRVIADETAGIRIPLALRDEVQNRLRQIADPDGGALDEISTVFTALTLDVPDLEPADRDALVALVDQEIEQSLRPAYSQLIQTLSESATMNSDRLGVWAQPQGEDLFLGILNASTGETVALERLHERHLEDAANFRDAIDRQLRSPPVESETELAIPETLAERLTWFESFFEPQPISDAETSDAADALSLSLETLAPKTAWTELGETPSFLAQSESLRALSSLWQTEPYATWLSVTQSDRQPLRALVEYPGMVDAWRIYIWTTPISDSGEQTRALDRVANESIALIQASLAAADTGIHLDRWTLDETISYLTTMTGLSETMTKQLALRIAARPGHQSATMVALHRLEALSERAKAVLGKQYSEREFQQTLIQKGPRPLDMIEKDIEAWYGERLAN